METCKDKNDIFLCVSYAGGDVGEASESKGTSGVWVNGRDVGRKLEIVRKPGEV